jgi:hypothetical protein
MINIGRRGSLGMAIEATSGTTTQVKHFIPYIENNLQGIHEVIADSQAKGVRESQGGSPVEGKKHGEGNISVVMNAKHSPHFFALALGNIESTDSITPLYRHTITRKADSQPRTATIWRDRVVDKVAFPYSAVDSLELNFADDVASLNASFMTRNPITGWTETPTIESLELYTFKNAYIELTNNSSTSELKVRDFTLNINNNLEMIYAPNSNDVDRIVSKNFEAGGSFTVLFEDETQKNAYQNLTKQALKVVFEGTTTGKITIEIPQFRLNSATINTPNNDVMTQDAEFIAEYNGNKSIDIVVDNDVEEYA